jgi:hypothetical protein
MSTTMIMIFGIAVTNLVGGFSIGLMVGMYRERYIYERYRPEDFS